MFTSSPKRAKQYGFSMVELMVVVAIIAVIASIAIPAYMGHLKESELATARMNMLSLQTYVEDFRLENGSYTAAGGVAGVWKAKDAAQRSLATKLGDWTPDGDGSLFDYTVEATANSYDVLIDNATAGVWVRCESRMTNCCSSDTAGATKAACP